MVQNALDFLNALDIKPSSKISRVSAEIVDLTHLKWATTYEKNGSTMGSYLKAYDTENGVGVYYKLSAFNIEVGVYGHESINEIVVNRLCSLLGFDYLKYELINAKINVDNHEYHAWLVKSYDFKKSGDKKITFESYCKMLGYDGVNKESLWDIIESIEFKNDIYKMVLLDYIIYNRDRHGANIEVLYNVKFNVYRLAPIFDNGLSLFATLQDNVDAILKYNDLINNPVNNYIGSMFLEDCLKTLRGKIKIPIINIQDLDLSDLEQCFETNGNIYIKRIKEMIGARYRHAVQILSS